MIVTSDTHFTSNEADEYRWNVFEDIQRLLKRDVDKHVYILGDLTDRRDRHPSDLVNRLIDTFGNLTKQGAKITVLEGNHDRPLYANKPYWSFLSAIPNVTFIRTPTADGRLLLLPFADPKIPEQSPRTVWQGITMDLYRAAFCHQTFRGASIGDDRVYQGDLSVAGLFPPSLRVYSGDVHIPQQLGHLTYVGSPHPIKFGDEYRCRLLVLDRGFDVLEDVTLYPPGKHTLRIESANDLNQAKVRNGDAARIRLTLPIDQINEWPEQQATIIKWAKQHGIALAGIEPIIETGPRDRQATGDFDDPIEVLASFAEAEGIDEEMLIAGLDIIEEAKGT